MRLGDVGGVEERRQYQRQVDWDKMREYLDAVEKYVPEKLSGDTRSGKAYKVAFAVYAVFDIVVFGVIPYIILRTLGNDAGLCTLLSVCAFICSLPFSFMMFEILWGRALAEERHREREMARVDRLNSTRKPEEHDDGEHELDEIRSIARAVDNIIETLPSCKSDDTAGKHVPNLSAFTDTVRDYVLLSFWDCHEKKLPQGFGDMVLRTSAAWAAYLELVAEGMSNKEADIAETHISKVIEQGNKTAWRNFNRVDSRVHGESHIFDLQDSPRPMTNLEKLAVAAEMAEEEA